MRRHPVVNSLHVPQSADGFQPPRADYPLPLLTRRRFGRIAGENLSQRHISPQRLAVNPAVSFRNPSAG